MPLTLTINVETPDQLLAAVQDLAQALNDKTTIVSTVAAGEPDPKPVETPPAQAKKPGRPKKDTAAPNPPVVDGTATVVEDDFTLDAAREKMRALAGEKGKNMAYVSAALEALGVERISDVPSKGVTFRTFIADIEKRIAEGG